MQWLDIFLRGIPKTVGTKAEGAWALPVMGSLSLSLITVLPGSVVLNK